MLASLVCITYSVFISNFKILLNDERLDNNDPGKSLEQEKCDDPREDLEKDTNATQETVGEEGGEGNVELCLDEDGDLHITHRPRKYPVEGRGRDLVCPIILKQSNPLLEQEEENTDDTADKCFKDIIRIEHTMATPLEDVGKQVWRGAFLLADFILSRRSCLEELQSLSLERIRVLQCCHGNHSQNSVLHRCGRRPSKHVQEKCDIKQTHDGACRW
ncbi:methyltransferase-like protein 22 isoform X2 [Hippoglossus stenolepis]|uniref:methyltransferase-like protein 22 isoform X2 n=1 Tax=Hippoglossus stenolepis TaxID=195615 RepID=UPI001FAE84C5|nr:methyltransferase-like protein 22 isoform X2 [Hippoglossus stenolepis]